METHPTNSKLLFIFNPRSGNNTVNWPEYITNFFSVLTYNVEIFILPKNCSTEALRNKINTIQPQRVIAVGGDGTVKLVAGCILHTKIVLGIIPAGSANGMAKELGIPSDPGLAMEVILKGDIISIHVVKVNDQYCIHLCDIGFNAFVVKKFESENVRGMFGYLKAAWKVMWVNPKMEVTIQTGERYIKLNAAMIVVANGTRYGSNAVINPAGKLDDDLFEVVIIKKISVREIFKMMVTHQPFDDDKTELLQTRSLSIQSRRKVHFQVDGEYQGKVNNIQAEIIPDSLKIVSAKK